MVNIYTTEQYIKVSYDDMYEKEQVVIIKEGVFFSTITGMNKRENYELFVDKLSVGETVILKPEPNNPVDPDAILVLWKEYEIGYIPKKHIPIVMPCINDNGSLAVIDKITEGFVGIRVKASFQNLGKRNLHYDTKLFFEIKETNGIRMFSEWSFSDFLYYSEEGVDDELEENRNKYLSLTHVNGYKWYDKDYRENHSKSDFMSEYSLDMEKIHDYDFFQDDNYLYSFIFVHDLLNTAKPDKKMLINDDFYLCSGESDCLVIYKPGQESYGFRAYINNDSKPYDDDYDTVQFQNKILFYAINNPERCILKLVDYNDFRIYSSVLSKMLFRVIIPKSDELLSFFASDDDIDDEFDDDSDDYIDDFLFDD